MFIMAKALLAGDPNHELVDTSQEYWNYTWDLHNRLVGVAKNGVQIVSYRYTAENFRVERRGSDGVTVYGYDLTGFLAYERNEGRGRERTIAYACGVVIGWTERQDGVSTRYYAATDQVGSVTKVLDGSGRVVWESEYTPYGNGAGVHGSIRLPGM